MLSPAVEDRLNKFQPPVEPKDFERLCVDVFEFILKARNIKISGESHGKVHAHGVSGDRQFGIDIIDPATSAVAQCKKQALIRVSALQKEIDLLMGYDKEISHYFFLISHSLVQKSLSDWVKKKNGEAQAITEEGERTPSLPSASLPKLHILGWDEIRSHLGRSNFLLWKWQILAPSGQFVHLEGLDRGELDHNVKRARNNLDPADHPLTLGAMEATETLLSTLDIDKISDFGKFELIDVCVIEGIELFLREMSVIYKAIGNYPEAIEKINKRDGVLREQGYELLNEIAKRKERIAAYPFLRKLMFDCRELVKCLSQPSSWAWEPEEIVDEYGVLRDIDGEKQRRFNFKKKKGTYYGVAYTDPKDVMKLAGKIVERVIYIATFTRE